MHNGCSKNAVMFTAIAELFYLLKKMLLIKKAYQKQHQAEYQLHATTLQELSGLGIKKLPSQEKDAPDKKAYCTKQLFLYAPGC